MEIFHVLLNVFDVDSLGVGKRGLNSERMSDIYIAQSIYMHFTSKSAYDTFSYRLQFFLSTFWGVKEKISSY